MRSFDEIYSAAKICDYCGKKFTGKTEHYHKYRTLCEECYLDFVLHESNAINERLGDTVLPTTMNHPTLKKIGRKGIAAIRLPPSDKHVNDIQKGEAVRQQGFLRYGRGGFMNGGKAFPRTKTDVWITSDPSDGHPSDIHHNFYWGVRNDTVVDDRGQVVAKGPVLDVTKGRADADKRILDRRVDVVDAIEKVL
jgi:hypothetical protein